MTIFRDLPMDLVEEILCYVPATYLKRLESTCKRWHFLFNGDSRFAMKHTDNAAKQFPVLLLKDYRIFPTIFNLLHRSVEFKSELSLIDSQSMYSAQFDIARIFHCDGWLLCTSKDTSRFVVWNPFTGETRWFQPNKRGVRRIEFFLGYYQKDNFRSYKILSFEQYGRKDYYEIYEFSSDSWRILDDIMASGWSIGEYDPSVSLKGKTYWFAADGPDLPNAQRNMSLLKFDFQTEKSVPVPLPYQCRSFVSCGLSVVREEKLSVMLQHDETSKHEIWVTNKIDETTTQVVSWSKVLALDLSHDLHIYDEVNFLLDEEKKVVMMRVTWLYCEDNATIVGKNMIYTVGEDDEVTQVELGTDDRLLRSFLNYVPSLVQLRVSRKQKETR